MTLTLSYDETLSRVVIEGSDLPDGFVRVERSVNEILWEVVRGGTAVEVEGGAFVLHDYEFFDSVENFYRVVEAVNETFTTASDNQEDGEAWQVPTGVNQLEVELWGGGGSGQGNSPPAATNTARPGGGGGAYSASTIPVSSGETLTIRVGEGGNPLAQLSVRDGASSFVKRGTSVLVEALGGGGAVAFTTPGTGGDASLGVGAVRFSGGDGGARQSEVTAGGGGGGSATAVADGSSGTAGALGIGGTGGAGEGEGGDGGNMPPGLWMPGTAGSYASTPHNAAIALTGDLDVRALISLDDWSPTVQMGLTGKWVLTGNQRSWLFAIGTGGNLQLYTSTDGTASVLTSSTVPVPVGSGPLLVRATLDVNNGAAGRVITFYTATATATGIATGPWTILGTAQTLAGAITLFNATLAGMEIGSWNNGANANLSGIVHQVQLRSGIDGTLVANPDLTAQPTDTNSFADSTGRTWTRFGATRIINETTVGQPGVSPGGGGGGQGNRVIFNPNTAGSGDGAPGQLNIRSWPGGDTAEGTSGSLTPDLEGEVWLKSVKYPFLNRVLECPDYDDITRAFRGAIFQVQGRSTPIAVSDLQESQQFTLTVVTRTLEQARDFDLTLAANPLFFLHVPAEQPVGCEARVSAVPGGYVKILDTTQRRIFKGSQTYTWTLPCVVVAKPDPQIIGTTLTWGTVLNRYGSSEQLIASNPTWMTLFQQVGSPDDLVVL